MEKKYGKVTELTEVTAWTESLSQSITFALFPCSSISESSSFSQCWRSFLLQSVCVATTCCLLSPCVRHWKSLTFGCHSQTSPWEVLDQDTFAICFSGDILTSDFVHQHCSWNRLLDLSYLQLQMKLQQCIGQSQSVPNLNKMTGKNPPHSYFSSLQKTDQVVQVGCEMSFLRSY